MVAVHHHICQSFAKYQILAFIGSGETVLFYVYWSINESTETAKNYLDSIPYILLLRYTVSISDFCLLNCWCRNLNIIHTECRYITQNIRRFAKHQ